LLYFNYTWIWYS